jgi:hypothetical protein
MFIEDFVQAIAANAHHANMFDLAGSAIYIFVDI